MYPVAHANWYVSGPKLSIPSQFSINEIRKSSPWSLFFQRVKILHWQKFSYSEISKDWIFSPWEWFLEVFLLHSKVLILWLIKDSFNYSLLNRPVTENIWLFLGDNIIEFFWVPRFSKLITVCIHVIKNRINNKLSNHKKENESVL